MKILISQRLSSIAIDYAICMLAGIPFVIVAMIFQAFTTEFYIQFISFALYLSIFLCKDFYKTGRSKGKEILKMKIVRCSDERQPTMNTLILRNIFLVIWPIEFIAILVNSERRLGDILLGTKIVRCQEDYLAPSLGLNSFLKYYAISLIYSLAIIVIILLLMQIINNNLFKTLNLLYS